MLFTIPLQQLVPANEMYTVGTALWAVSGLSMALAHLPLLFATIALFGRWPRPAALLPVIIVMLLAQPVWQVVRVSAVYAEWVGDATSMSDMILREFALVIPAGIGWALAVVSLLPRKSSGRLEPRAVLLALGAGFAGTISPFTFGLVTCVAIVVAVLLIAGRPRASAEPSTVDDASVGAG